MTKKPDIFRLKYLFSPSYITGRLSDINSFSDALRRIGGILIYIAHMALNGCYKIIGFLISAWRAAVGFSVFVWSKTEGLYYIFRGWWISGREKVFGFARNIAKAPVYAAHMVLKSFYKARGVFILALSKAEVSYYAVRGLCIFGYKKISEFMRYIVAWIRVCKIYTGIFLYKVFLKIKAGKVYIETKLRDGLYKLEFFGDIYRDFALKTGLAGLNPISDIRMKRRMSVDPTDNATDNSLRVLWLMNPLCNYKCTYCWLHGSRPAVEEFEGYVKRSKEEYIRGWELFNQKYGPAKIEIVGGEPFVDPDFMDVLSALSVKNTIFIITNLSWNPKAIIGRIDPAKLSFLVSYHPGHEPSVERFIGKINALQEAGFFTGASIVAWPPYLSKLPSLLKEFYFRGINVLVEPFIGRWRGRLYPQAYTAFESKAIKNINHGEYIFPYLYDNGPFCADKGAKWDRKPEINFAISFQFANDSPKGKLCNAGHSYFRIPYNGEVRRCGHGERLGDFFNGNFHLLDKPKPCQLDKCYCLGENLCLEGGAYGPKTTGYRGEGSGQRIEARNKENSVDTKI